MPEINVWAVVLATVSTLAIGSVFYLPQVFGRRWWHLVGQDSPDVFALQSGDPEAEAPGGGVGWVLPAVAVSSAMTALVLASGVFYVHAFDGGSFFLVAVGVGLALWAGFTAARIFIHGLFDTRSIQVPVLNAVHELVSVLSMSLIIGVWPPAGL